MLSGGTGGERGLGWNALFQRPEADALLRLLGEEELGLPVHKDKGRASRVAGRLLDLGCGQARDTGDTFKPVIS